MSQKNDIETEVKTTGHIYDGIEELDHPTPNWFMVLFYLTIVFGIGYFFHYTLGDGVTLVQEYHRDKDAEEYALYERGVKTGVTKVASDDELKVLLKDPAKRTLGSTTFQAKCASCHGARGMGGIGPNLTDAYWIHGGKMSEILTTITQGISEKGMPPWGPVLSEEEIQAVTVYIRSISGSNPVGAKAPQGTLVKTEL